MLVIVWVEKQGSFQWLVTEVMQQVPWEEKKYEVIGYALCFSSFLISWKTLIFSIEEHYTNEDELKPKAKEWRWFLWKVLSHVTLPTLHLI